MRNRKTTRAGAALVFVVVAAAGVLAMQRPAPELCAELVNGSRCSWDFPPKYGRDQFIQNKRTDTTVKVTVMIGDYQFVRNVPAGGRILLRCRTSPPARIVGCDPGCP